MPTKQEKIINELYKYFGIFSYDVLSDYEKRIYAKFHDSGKESDQIRTDLKEQFAKHAHNSSYPGQYVDELRKTDSFIQKADLQISSLKVNNEEIKSKANGLDAPINDLQKESDNYQKKINELNDKYDKADQKAKASLEEAKKKVDKMVLEREKEIYKKNTNIKIRLSDYQIQESKYANYVSKLVYDKDLLVAQKGKLKTGSKEFNEIEKKIEKIDSDIVLHNNNLVILKTEIAKIDEEVQGIENELNDQTFKNTEYQKAQDVYNKTMSKFDSVKNQIKELSDKKSSVDNQIKELSDNKEKLLDNVYKAEKEIFNLEIDCLNYAKDIANRKREEVRNELKELDQYEIIESAINNKVPKITSTGIVNGLSLVKEAYQDYYNKHSAVGRFFKFLPFTSAHKDYQDFSEVRRRYMDLSNIKQTEIDHYLDHNELSGELLEKSNIIDNEVVDKILTNNSVMDKRTYKKNELASNEAYLKACENIYKTEIMVPQTNMGCAFVTVDKGLKLLNELGNIKREGGNKEVDEMINKISNATMQFGRFGKRGDVIEEEIANALKPENERKIIIFEMPSYLKEMYDKAKLEEATKLENDDNAILFGNEKTFAKITVNEASLEEEKQEISEEIEEENLENVNENSKGMEV